MASTAPTPTFTSRLSAKKEQRLPTKLTKTPLSWITCAWLKNLKDAASNLELSNVLRVGNVEHMTKNGGTKFLTAIYAPTLNST